MRLRGKAEKEPPCQSIYEFPITHFLGEPLLPSRLKVALHVFRGAALNESCLGRWRQAPFLEVSGHLVPPFYCSVNMPPDARDPTMYLSGACSLKIVAREQAAELALSAYLRPALPPGIDMSLTTGISATSRTLDPISPFLSSSYISTFLCGSPYKYIAKKYSSALWTTA